jgi:BirA family biotin operon repressor/biotin-[acetyl-CoA-carboxylase] ligase
MPTPQRFPDKNEPVAVFGVQELLSLLADGRFHSGDMVGKAAGVSRAAVWKLVEQLRGLGLPIEAVKGRGYRLPQPVELLDAAAIVAELAWAYPRQLPVELVFQCGSTNRLLLERARAGAASQALTTEIQTAGRGRWGRTWIAPFGSAVCLSVLWRFPVLPQGLAGLSLAVAVAIGELLRAERVPVELKWPNDLLLQGRKLGGILVEVVGEVEGPCAVVIGLGLNLTSLDAIEAATEQPVAVLEEALGERARARNYLIARLVAAIARACERFATEGFAPYAKLWQQYDAFAGTPVVLMLPNEEVRGIARGVDERGALLLERDGRVEARFSGDLRLRLRRDPIA